MIAEFDHEMATTRKLIERIPDDRLRWRPHDKSRTLGSLALHLATIPAWTPNILERLEFDLAELPAGGEDPATRAAILTRLAESVAAARRALDKTDAELWAMWSLRRDGHEVFTIPRWSAVRSFVLSHIVHHRGQLSVYLRLNGIAVPAIYGPTADEC